MHIDCGAIMFVQLEVKHRPKDWHISWFMAQVIGVVAIPASECVLNFEVYSNFIDLYTYPPLRFYSE